MARDLGERAAAHGDEEALERIVVPRERGPVGVPVLARDRVLRVGQLDRAPQRRVVELGCARQRRAQPGEGGGIAGSCGTHEPLGVPSKQ
jgi:hypothetical protein